MRNVPVRGEALCKLDELQLADPRGKTTRGDDWDGLTGLIAPLSKLPHPQADEPPAFDPELEYLIVYGQVTGGLPTVKDVVLVARLTGILETALSDSDHFRGTRAGAASLEDGYDLRRFG